MDRHDHIGNRHAPAARSAMPGSTAARTAGPRQYNGDAERGARSGGIHQRCTSPGSARVAIAVTITTLTATGLGARDRRRGRFVTYLGRCPASRKRTSSLAAPNRSLRHARAGADAPSRSKTAPYPPGVESRGRRWRRLGNMADDQHRGCRLPGETHHRGVHSRNASPRRRAGTRQLNGRIESMTSSAGRCARPALHGSRSFRHDLNRFHETPAAAPQRHRRGFLAGG